MGVVVAGALANKAGSAGEAWGRMSWTRGFEQLGLDVRFVEELAPAAVTADSVRWFEDVTGRFGLTGRATLVAEGNGVAGPAVEELLDFAGDATLVNISGHL